MQKTLLPILEAACLSNEVKLNLKHKEVFLSSIFKHLRVNSNSVSEALLTVLKVLLA